MTFSNSINWYRRDPLHCENIGISQSSGTTFTVKGADGNDLSTNNPGFITVESKANPGQKKVYRITANQSFTQSDIASNNFGLTNGVAHANDIPFFLYAVVDDTETSIAFMVSRYPNTPTSPTSAKIGKAGSAVANSQGSFFSLANVTVTSYDGNPCLCIGSFKMTWSNTNNWTITTLSATDGIGMFQESSTFTMSAGQYGAASGKYFYDNGGTAPSFASNGNGYFVDRFNNLHLGTSFQDSTGGAGAGAVNLQLASPYVLGGSVLGSAFIINAAGADFVATSAVQPSGASNKVILYFANDTSSGILSNANVTAGAAYAISHFVKERIVFS